MHGPARSVDLYALKSQRLAQISNGLIKGMGATWGYMGIYRVIVPQNEEHVKRNEKCNGIRVTVQFALSEVVLGDVLWFSFRRSEG